MLLTHDFVPFINKNKKVIWEQHRQLGWMAIQEVEGLNSIKLKPVKILYILNYRNHKHKEKKNNFIHEHGFIEDVANDMIKDDKNQQPQDSMRHQKRKFMSCSR